MGYGAKKRPKDGIHRAEAGDTISSIAASYGITEWESRVWNAPENAKLKESRLNPNELMPGDEVFLPELQEKREPRPTDAWHDFHVIRNKRFLRLKLQNADGSAIANKPYTIEPDRSFRGVFVQQGTATDPDGKIEEEIPHTLTHANLNVPDENIRVKLNIGYLQPMPATEPVKGLSLNASGAAQGVMSVASAAAASLSGIASGAAGSLVGAAKGAASGAVGGSLSGGLSVGKGGISTSGSGGASGAGSALGELAGQAKDIAAGASKNLLASATAMVGAAAKAVSGALGLDSLGKDTDPNIYPAAQRLHSMGFHPGDPKDNKRTAQFSGALMEFQTWCKKQGQLADNAGGPLGSLTSPGGILGGGGGPLGDIASAVAGPMLASVGLTGQLDDDTIKALKKVHGC